MNSSTINFYDLAILREIIPFLRLRLRIILKYLSGQVDFRFDNILIVAPCILGDCLSCLPAIEEHYRRSHKPYDIIVSPDFRSLAEHLKGVRRVFVASSSYNRATERKTGGTTDMPGEYDLIIVLRISPEAFKLIKHVKCRRLISSDGSLLKYIFRVARNSLIGRPVAQAREIMFDTLKLSDPSVNGRLPSPFELPDDLVDGSAQSHVVGGGSRTILVHPGSGWQVKLWSDERWVELLTKIHSLDHCRFIFVGRGDSEASAFERIQSRLNFKVYSSINDLNLWELFLLMKRSDGFIGIDSGPRNLAHYAGIRSVTLLNPAAVNNFMPLDTRDVIVERQNRFPANVVNTKRGANLTDITAEEVFEAYKQIRRYMSPAEPVQKRGIPAGLVASQLRTQGATNVTFE
ncbi:MAG TPA: glycosyltransferase family 9 protein [candidate division Zixibacteria bacterium]|nr:glycosyltransferase family 9 protein [candidate division Zixibacteria bacterium]